MSIIPMKEGAKETTEPQNHWLVEILGLERVFWERVSMGVRRDWSGLGLFFCFFGDSRVSLGFCDPKPPCP